MRGAAWRKPADLRDTFTLAPNDPAWHVRVVDDVVDPLPMDDLDFLAVAPMVPSNCIVPKLEITVRRPSYDLDVDVTWPPTLVQWQGDPGDADADAAVDFWVSGASGEHDNEETAIAIPWDGETKAWRVRIWEHGVPGAWQTLEVTDEEVFRPCGCGSRPGSEPVFALLFAAWLPFRRRRTVVRLP